MENTRRLEGTIEVEVPADRLGWLLNAMCTPIAVMLGTVPPPLEQPPEESRG